MATPIYLKKCISTNDEILRFLPLMEEKFVAIYTFNQTGGKGQYGNSWETAENLNLAFTIGVPANAIQLPHHLFNFHTALLVADFVANLTNEKIEIKWPNDLILRNKKISGLLIDKMKVSESDYFIIGIGINILQKNFAHLPKAGSLFTQTGLQFDLHHVAHSLSDNLALHIIENISAEEILKKINQLLFRKEMVSVFEINSLRQNGIIIEIDKEGFLWVELEKNGLRKFYHKEIELLY